MKGLELTPGRFVGDNHPVFIIAEIGQNHQGDIATAKELMLAAKKSGADCVKFQKSSLEDKFTASALLRKYESPHSFGDTYGDHKRHLEFSCDEYKELMRYAREELDIPMTASAMDEVSVDFLVDLGVPFIKIGSGDVTNPIVVEKAAMRTQFPLVVSTGMCDMKDVREVYNLLKTHRAKHGNNFSLLQCTSAYPTPPEDSNLRVIQTYQKEFPDIEIGYSGHEEGFVETLGAVALGAKIIERHFTLDNSMKGSDHKCSLQVNVFSDMVRSIRLLEASLGSPLKQFQPCEIPCHSKLGKSVVASKDLEKGHLLTMEDLKVKVGEPLGWRPQKLKELIGRVCQRSVARDETILEEFLE